MIHDLDTRRAMRELEREREAAQEDAAVVRRALHDLLDISFHPSTASPFVRTHACELLGHPPRDRAAEGGPCYCTRSAGR